MINRIGGRFPETKDLIKWNARKIVKKYLPVQNIQ